MERYTRTEGGRAAVEPGQIENALARLAAFEDLAFGLEAEQASIAARLEQLRGQHREKTVQFRELMAQKLTNTSLLVLLERHGLRP